MTERSSGTRYSRKNSGGTPPSKPYPLSQQLPDRGSKASKCRPTKLIPPPKLLNCVEVNSYMLPHRHCTCLISVTGSDRSCICRRTPAHNRWNRHMSYRLCGHSLRYCREEVCFLLHYPYTSPSLYAGYCSFNQKSRERAEFLVSYIIRSQEGNTSN